MYKRQEFIERDVLCANRIVGNFGHGNSTPARDRFVRLVVWAVLYLAHNKKVKGFGLQVIPSAANLQPALSQIISANSSNGARARPQDDAVGAHIFALAANALEQHAVGDAGGHKICVVAGY